MVHFVGAGPGAADLITVRGAELLKKADIIIYAGSLVNRELLSYAPDTAKIYDSKNMNLQQIIEVMKDAENAGLETVRLHTGEPSLYGAVREQMDELDKLGIEYFGCLWCGCGSESGIHSSGGFTVTDHHENGGTDRSA